MERKLKIPYKFCGKNYSDADELYKAFLEKWDMAAAALKRGALAEYFKKLSEEDTEHTIEWKFFYRVSCNLREEMWNDEFHEDAVFGKFMYYFSRFHGPQRYPQMPMEDADVSKSEVIFKELIDPPKEGLGDHFRYRAYGSRTRNRPFREAAYIDYMTEESWKVRLAMIDWNHNVFSDDSATPDETAGQKPEKVHMVDCMATLDKVYWWQEYLREIGEFE